MLFNLVFCSLIFTKTAYSQCDENEQFPRDFKFGVSTSSYQTEGGWNQGGKGENLWDFVTHSDEAIIADNSNGDIACDSYNKYQEDIKILKELDVQTYRFSLSWARILPDGTNNSINNEGMQYYKNLIAGLKSAGIEPMVTLYHWDLPMELKKIGGWLNESMVDHFAGYAKVAFDSFGDDVKMWTTFNEPYIFCYYHFKYTDRNSTGWGEYICGHTVLKAHAKVYHMYNQEYKPKQKGKISIVLNFQWKIPASDSLQDQEAALRATQFELGWFAHPIFVGNYPQIMISRIKERSLQENYTKSRLPEFTQEELLNIKGTHDYFGLNIYTASLVKYINETKIGKADFKKDLNVFHYKNVTWSGLDLSKIVPFAIRNGLKWIRDNYNNPEVIVTENGYGDYGIMEDFERIKYFKEYLKAVLEAITIDKVNVTGYMAWSLMDNFEWLDGYTIKFGLYNVNFDDPERTRTPKLSAKYYKGVISAKCVNSLGSSIVFTPTALVLILICKLLISYVM